MSVAEPNALDIDGIIRAAFAPFKSAWLSVLIRVGLPYFLLTLMLWGLMGWVFYHLGAPAFQAILNGEKPDPDLVKRLQPLSLLLVMVMVIPTALARTALFRLHAGEGLKGQFFAFRFGADELRQYFVLWLRGILVYMVPLGLLFGAVILTIKTDANFAVGALLVSIGCIVWFVLMLLFGVRLSLMPAQIFNAKRMTIFRSWRLSQGHFWLLFLGFGVLIVFYGLVSLLVTSPANILFYAQDASGLLGDPEILKGMAPSDVKILMRETFLNGKAAIAIIWLVLMQFIMDVYRLMMFSAASYACVQTLENAK